MFAIGAILAFAIALILNLIGGHSAKYVTDFELVGLILVAVHLAWGWRPWVRTRPVA